ncbi:MAG: hypothetical protein ABWX93_09110 [Pseudoxanthomonas sp.]
MFSKVDFFTAGKSGEGTLANAADNGMKLSTFTTRHPQAFAGRRFKLRSNP